MRWKRQPRSEEHRQPSPSALTSQDLALPTMHRRSALELAGSCIGVGFAIGIWSAPRGDFFNWEIGVLSCTALATVLLAGYTAMLARATLTVANTTAALAAITSQDATATQQLVQIAQEDQRRAIEPVIVVTDRNRINLVTEQGISTATWEVALRNIGKGPALDIMLFSYSLPSDGKPTDEVFLMRLSAMAPLETEEIVIQTKNLESPIPIGGTFTDSSERGDRLTFGYNGMKRRRDEAGSA